MGNLHLRWGTQLQRVVYRIDSVATHVTKSTGPKIPIPPPVKTMVDLWHIRTVRSRPQPLVPSQTIRDWMRPPWTPPPLLPKTNRTIGPNMRLLNPTDDAVLDQFHRSLEISPRVMLCSHLGDHSEFLCRPGQLTCLINIMSQRFLTINMLPLSNRSHADGGVHVIRRGDGDGFNIGMLQQSPPVLMTLGPGKASRGSVEFPIIDITYRHHVLPF